MISLQDKVVIITGGGRGIGFGLSTAFAKAGAKLVITGRTESTLLSAKEKLEAAHGCEVLTVTADGADEAAIQNVIDKTIERFGKIDAVVNNASLDRPTRASCFDLCLISSTAKSSCSLEPSFTALVAYFV